MTTRPISDKNRRICEMRLEGMTLAAIADVMGISRARVGQITQKYRVPSPPRARLPEKVAERCGHCGAEFLIKRGNKRKYCNPACRRDAQSHKPSSHYGTVDLVCDGCGEHFERSKHVFQIGLWMARKRGRSTKRNFCCRDCYTRHGRGRRRKQIKREMETVAS
ncbi:MAG: hypothetical protein OER86_06155 [Phycisphaerae bacterium]|nr:hypothetical protein [Phycisphaerae bacterium]